MQRMPMRPGDDDEDDDDFEEPEDETPQVVVLKTGDLTKEEADQTRQQQEVTPISVDKVTDKGRTQTNAPSNVDPPQWPVTRSFRRCFQAAFWH